MITASKPKTKKKTATTTEEVPLLEMDIRVFKITVKGITPLLQHDFSEKARKMIRDKKEKKAASARVKCNPEQECRDAMIVMPGYYSKRGEPGCHYAAKAMWFKKAAIHAVTHIQGLTKVAANSAFHVVGDESDLIRLNYKKLNIREDTVRVGMGAADLRYRPEFQDWWCDITIRYNHSAISPEQIINMFNIAGFGCGVGDWRPQKNGTFGMFEVALG